MADVTLTAQTAAAAGVLLTWTPGDGTNDVLFANTGHEVLLVKNSHASDAKTVTILTGGTVNGIAIADVAQSVAAAAIYAYGPLPKYIFDGAGTDTVTVDGPSTSLVFALLKV